MAASTRLYFIIARKAPVAVVFRRGPSQQVELLIWNLTTDELTPGQWLKGRIYERRCDLSPSGRYLVYFAAKWGTKLRTWTAISRPPYLTALALWAKGDAWGGGGLFESERRIALNHRANEMDMEQGFELARSLRVVPLGEGSGWGEDDPLHGLRLIRDRWRWIDNGAKGTMQEFGSRHFYTFDPPIRWERDFTKDRGLTLEMSIESLHERNGPWYVLSYRLMKGSAVVRDLGRADWTDVAPNGDLLLARDGQILRAIAKTDGVLDEPFFVVADLRDHRFESRIAPSEFQTW